MSEGTEVRLTGIAFVTLRDSVVRPAGPHAEGGFLDKIRVAVTEAGVEAAAVALADVAHGRVLRVRFIEQVGRAEAGVVPRVRLLNAPDFEDGEAGVANCDGPCRVLDVSQVAAGRRLRSARVSSFRRISKHNNSRRAAEDGRPCQSR